MQYTDYLEAYSDDYYSTVYDYPLDVQLLFIQLEWTMEIHLYLRAYHLETLYFMKETERIKGFLLKGNAFLTKLNEIIFEELLHEILPLKEISNELYLKQFQEIAKKSHRLVKESIPLWVNEHLPISVESKP